MNTAKQINLTAEGMEKLEAELDYLKTVRRKEVSERIKVALSFGDLSENSEYDEAKNEQARVEVKIAEIESKLKHAKVIDTQELDMSVVSLGSKVKVLDLEFNDEMVYTIVGSTEADPKKFKMSDESPVGKALIGKKVGDQVDVEVPAGIFQCKVLEIMRA